jgi:hypothetical protein
MSIEWNEEKVGSYIRDKIEESINLDYEAAGALAKRPEKIVEITKDISAFANSAGGTIIYGLREFAAEDKRHMAEKLDPIDRREFSKEWLEHIAGKIQPRPATVIHPVQLASAPEHVAYVVEIAQGTTAHQADDCRYYRRYNFESVPMRDFEVRDVMHRKVIPVVKTELRIIVGRHGWENKLIWIVRNESDVLARWVCTIIQMPCFILGKLIHFKDTEMVMDDDDFSFWRLTPSNHLGGPLFPRGSLRAEFSFTYGEISQLEGKELRARDMVRFKTYADEMPACAGAVDLKQITLHQTLA